MKMFCIVVIVVYFRDNKHTHVLLPITVFFLIDFFCTCKQFRDYRLTDAQIFSFWHVPEENPTILTIFLMISLWSSLTKSHNFSVTSFFSARWGMPRMLVTFCRYAYFFKVAEPIKYFCTAYGLQLKGSFNNHKFGSPAWVQHKIWYCSLLSDIMNVMLDKRFCLFAMIASEWMAAGRSYFVT
jgi:hypothetical protein